MSDADKMCAETPMRDHVSRFWEEIRSNHVRVMVDMRRVISHDSGEETVYWDGSSFPDNTAKAILASFDHLQARNRMLEEALKPFANIEVGIYGLPDDETPDSAEWFRHDGDVLRVGDFRKARALLTPEQPSS
jgi:hypothetical protein